VKRAGVPAAAVSRWSACYQANRFDACEAIAEQLARDFPDAGKAWQLLAMSRFACGDLAAAQAHLRRAARLESRDRSIWDNLGVVLQQSRDHAGARAAFGTALALDPAAAGIWSNAAGNELDDGDPATAERLARKAIGLQPRLAAGWLQLGNALARLRRSAEAEAALREALRLQPGYAEAWLSLSAALAAQNRLREAVAAAREALRLAPGLGRAHVNLGGIYDQLGELGAASEQYRRARELNPADLGAWSSELYCLSHDANLDPQQVFLAHRSFGEHVETHFAGKRAPHDNDRDPHRPLRVGVVSADLRDHPVARFLEPIWKRLDAAEVRLVAYDNAPSDDAVARQLRSHAEDWIDVSRLTDDALAARIRADRIDILIDHSGHTAGNRIGVFARKPAPVQVMWFGYPGTSGLRTMDYRLVDPVVAPPGRLDHLFTEQLAYLPAMLVLAKPADLPPLRPAPCVDHGYLTYGSFNRMNKLGDAVLGLWARILARVPRSRLLVGAVPDADAATALRRRMLATGIDAARVEFLPRLAMADYLRAHERIDLLLDAFPWTSGTTAHLGLWMGVPTLTLAGQSLAARLGAGAMAAAGLQEFVAESADRYVETAVQAAVQPDRLHAVRMTLRDRLERDRERIPALVARALEQRLRQMWQRWCAGLSPCVLSDTPIRREGI